MPVPRACLDCGTATRNGSRCPVHQQQQDRKRAIKQQAHGRNTSYWRKLRKLVLNRDGHTCQRCGKPGNSVHIDPRLRGNHLLATPNRAITLCASCHGTIDGPRASGKEAADAGFFA
jgi:5-methylcytosine-specific restriction endonuclease McrA